MFEKKPWYLSKTVILGMVVIGMGLYGVDVDETMIKTINENLGKVIELAGVAAMIYARVTATSTLTATKKTETIAEYVPPSVEIQEPLPVPAQLAMPAPAPIIDDARG